MYAADASDDIYRRAGYKYVHTVMGYDPICSARTAVGCMYLWGHRSVLLVPHGTMATRHPQIVHRLSSAR
jgi:hypothetical protein